MVGSSSAPHRFAAQAFALLLASDREINAAIARECSTTPEAVRRWRCTFAGDGVEAVGSIALGRVRESEILLDEELGVAEQQAQRYEATEYRSASPGSATSPPCSTSTSLNRPNAATRIAGSSDLGGVCSA
jgi:hypothetical protein